MDIITSESIVSNEKSRIDFFLVFLVDMFRTYVLYV